jgi:hypothetical protein
LRIFADCVHAGVAVGFLLAFLGVSPFNDGLVLFFLVTYALAWISFVIFVLVRAGIERFRARKSD